MKSSPLDTELFLKMLSTDSTSGRERPFALELASLLKTGHNTAELMEVGDGTLNLVFRWGSPKIWFCTHMDTVPPYIPPTVEKLPDGDVKFRGRGTCDAKGQIFSMFEACRELERRGETDFALLLLAGEETGSFGAKAYTRDMPGGEFVTVGEPTDNRMVSASKGTKSFAVTLKGRPCHSGYPERGDSAVEKFYLFMKKLHETSFPADDRLGATTWNIGKLSSPNPQNILSPELKFRLYFRTTFASDKAVCDFMDSMRADDSEIESFGGDAPMEYYTPDGIPTETVAFGSDAPQLKKFRLRALCGPGSILVAHTPDEFVLLSDLLRARDNYLRIAADRNK